ncbi:MAG: hypothetical protein ACK5KU_09730 [Beutenbergiaceae bacterium]
MASIPLLSPTTPRTTVQVLEARGGNPADVTHELITSAMTSLSQILVLLPPQQRQLRNQFLTLFTLLQQVQPLLAPDSPLYWRQRPGYYSDESAEPASRRMTVITGAPVGEKLASIDGEAIYGFSQSLAELMEYLRFATSQWLTGAQHVGFPRIAMAANLAHAASAVDHLAVMFGAAMWAFEHPPVPGIPASGGRIELRPGPRATPMTKWARQARVLFMADRVELITATGREVIGTPTPIAFLMHVVPGAPASVVQRYDPAERYAPVEHFDDLGVIHFCHAGGNSLGSIAVADWLAQPAITLAQGAHTGPPTGLRGYERSVHALRAAGITAGAATLGVPIKLGVQHPRNFIQLRDDSFLFRPGAYAEAARPPSIAARPIRPAPHFTPYMGWATNPMRALLRRKRRRGARSVDLGPGNPVTEILRWCYPGTLWAGMVLTSLFPTWWTLMLVLIAMATVAEPWLTWLFRWLTDINRQPIKASYQPGTGTSSTRGFQLRARLFFDGTDIGVRSGSGHQVWVSGPSDPDRGVVALHRLTHEGSTWGFAFVDRIGDWRLVLPAPAWVEGDNVNPLAGFAQAAGLELSDYETAPVDLTNDVLAPISGTATATHPRSSGPLTAGMVRTAIHAVLAGVVIAVLGTITAFQALAVAAIAAIALIPVACRAIWRRWARGS